MVVLGSHCSPERLRAEWPSQVSSFFSPLVSRPVPLPASSASAWVSQLRRQDSLNSEIFANEPTGLSPVRGQLHGAQTELNRVRSRHDTASPGQRSAASPQVSGNGA